MIDVEETKLRDQILQLEHRISRIGDEYLQSVCRQNIRYFQDQLRNMRLQNERCIVADDDMRLQNERRIAADDVFQNFPFDDLEVSATDQWQCTALGVEYTRAVYFENPDHRGGASRKGRFTVVFEGEQSVLVRSAYATIDGQDVGTPMIVDSPSP